jgi:hypothetical protein
MKLGFHLNDFDWADGGASADRAKIEALLSKLRWMAGMGVQTVIGFVPHVDRITPLEIVGREVSPRRR